VTPELADAPFTALDDSLARLDQAVSPLVGIVGPVTHTTYVDDESSLSHVACRLASGLRTIGARTVEYGGGVAPAADRARAAAIGEALERYSGAFVPAEALRWTTAAALGAKAVAPERFALFHPRQHDLPGFPFVPFTADLRIHWVEGRRLPGGEPAWLPAQLVYLRSPDPPTSAIGFPTSNGLACGATRDEAVLAGLLELVERDAVMLAWNNRLSLPRLDWADDPELVALDRRFFARSGLSYSVLDGSVFLGIPVGIAVVHGPPGERTALAVGAGCGRTVAAAWLKALSEAFGVRRWLRAHTLIDPERTIDDPFEIGSFDDHMLYYASHAHARLAAFLDESPQTTATRAVVPLKAAAPRRLVEEVVERLAQHDVSVYAVDVTAPDVRSLGLHVARVVCPELCALDVSHGARYLGGRRLYHAVNEAGLAARPLEPAELNPLPHPFP
jgi:ribosomal protein S12 methylthiotransferase accessory factor